jgi:hypothetical protein
MRIYLELYEITEEGEGDFIRIDVTDWSSEDIEEAINLLREHAQNYSSYVIQKHYCYHDEFRSCSVEIYESRSP